MVVGCQAPCTRDGWWLDHWGDQEELLSEYLKVCRDARVQWCYSCGQSDSTFCYSIMSLPSIFIWSLTVSINSPGDKMMFLVVPVSLLTNFRRSGAENVCIARCVRSAIHSQAIKTAFICWSMLNVQSSLVELCDVVQKQQL